MSATKRFFHDCAEAGRCPISRETWDWLDAMEAVDPTLGWIGYCEHDYRGHDGQLYIEDCITIESARRLVAEGLANMEIIQFVENWGELCPA